MIKQWVHSLSSFSRGSNKPPFDDLEPTVEWQVNGHCNYDCSYCIQSKKSRIGFPDDSTVSAIISQFAQLPGQWEVKMSGGEPFAFKGFINQVIPELVSRTPHRISTLTNFSAPLNVLERFCQLTGDRLRITSASLHPESVDVDSFIDKAIAYRNLRATHNPNSSFVANVVLVPGRVKNHFKYQERFGSEDLRYFPQLMKIKGGVYPYDAAEQQMIEQLTGGSHDPQTVNRAPSYEGLHCEAGVWYFTVDQTGEAYTCRTGKRFLDVNDQGRMGNLVDGTFKLRTRGGKCPYPICPCTVPANRGIVRLKKNRQPKTVTVERPRDLVQLSGGRDGN